MGTPPPPPPAFAEEEGEVANAEGCALDKWVNGKGDRIEKGGWKKASVSARQKGGGGLALEAAERKGGGEKGRPSRQYVIRGGLRLPVSLAEVEEGGSRTKEAEQTRRKHLHPRREVRGTPDDRTPIRPARCLDPLPSS